MAWIDRKKIGRKLIMDLMNVAEDNAVLTTIIIILMPSFKPSFNRRWETFIYLMIENFSFSFFFSPSFSDQFHYIG